MRGPCSGDTAETPGAVTSGRVFDSSPAHSGLSSSKFTAKSCDTFTRGMSGGKRKKRKKRKAITGALEQPAFEPIYGLTDAFPFHVDQRRGRNFRVAPDAHVPNVLP